MNHITKYNKNQSKADTIFIHLNYFVKIGGDDVSEIDLNEEAKIEIFSNGCTHYACVQLYDTIHTVGPSLNRFELHLMILDFIDDLRTVADVKAIQDKTINELKQCLLNLSLEW